MPTLSSAELEAMQAVQNRHMPQVGTIIRFTTVPGILGPEETPGTIGTVPCRLVKIQDQSLSERVSGAQLISISEWTISFPVGTDVTAKDKVGVGDQIFELLDTKEHMTYLTEIRFNAEVDPEFTL